MTETPEPPRAVITLRGAAFLGIGGMVGAGIFSLLGEAGSVAGSAVWISFLIAGGISLCLGYTLAKLGVQYPSSGGTVTYLVKGFGNGRLVGVASWLAYLTAVVVVGAMIARSFGDYAKSLFVGSDAGNGWTTLFAALIVLAAALVAFVGPRWVTRASSVIVTAELAVFAVFIVATFGDLHPHLLAPSGYPSLREIISAVALTFFAFLGFAVICFAAGDMRSPERDLPRAMYIALGSTTILYIAIALAVFGTLSVPEVVGYGPTAIAEAARGSLGDAGYTAMSVAALLSTSSAVISTLYASTGFTSALAEVGQFPPVFGTESRLGRHAGLSITTGLMLAFIVLFDLGALATIGSGVSLAGFALVGLAGLKLAPKIGARTTIVLTGITCSCVVLAVFLIDTYHDDPRAFWTMPLLLAGAIVTDLSWKRASRRGRAAVA